MYKNEEKQTKPTYKTFQKNKADLHLNWGASTPNIKITPEELLPLAFKQEAPPPDNPKVMT